MSVTQESHINGVDTATLFATIGAVRDQPELREVPVPHRHDWVSGTHSEGRFPGFYGAGQEHTHVHADGGPGGPPRRARRPGQRADPGRAAAQRPGRVPDGRARATSLRPVASSCTDVRCRVEGDIDLRGLLGIDDTVRNGFESIRVVFSVDGDAEAEQLAALVEQSHARSAVFDVLTHGTAVTVEVDGAEGAARTRQ